MSTRGSFVAAWWRLAAAVGTARLSGTSGTSRTRTGRKRRTGRAGPPGAGERAPAPAARPGPTRPSVATQRASERNTCAGLLGDIKSTSNTSRLLIRVRLGSYPANPQYAATPDHCLTETSGFSQQHSFSINNGTSACGFHRQCKAPIHRSVAGGNGPQRAEVFPATAGCERQEVVATARGLRDQTVRRARGISLTAPGDSAAMRRENPRVHRHPIRNPPKDGWIHRPCVAPRSTQGTRYPADYSAGRKLRTLTPRFCRVSPDRAPARALASPPRSASARRVSPTRGGRGTPPC